MLMELVIAAPEVLTTSTLPVLLLKLSLRVMLKLGGADREKGARAWVRARQGVVGKAICA